MPQNDMEALGRYLNRIRPIYHQLFNLAHAVTGSCEAAEYALQYAMLECWTSEEREGRGFRDGMRRSVIRAAMKAEGGEYDWEGLPAPDESDPLRQMIAGEPPELQRMLALRAGCGLSAGRIAKLCGCDVRRVKALLRRLELKVKRRLPASGRSERRIDRAVRASLHMDSGLAPEMGSVFRSFQSDAAGKSRGSGLAARIARILLSAVLALLCIALFWFAAVILQPPVMEEAGIEAGSIETIQEGEDFYEEELA